MSTRVGWISLLSMLVVLAANGCGDDHTPTGPSSGGSTSPVATVTVAGARTTIGLDQTMQFDATAKRQDGTSASCTTDAAWRSSNNAIVTVSTAGLAHAVAEGEADLTATCGGVTGTVHVVVVRVHASRVTVSPTQVTLAPGEAQQFTANVCYNDGTCGECTRTAHWENLGSPTMNLDNDQHKGLVTALKVGGGSLRVSCEGPFTYASVSVRIPDDQFTHRAEYAGGLCALVTPNTPYPPATPCAYGGTSTQASVFVDVNTAGWLQLFVSGYGGHDYGDGVNVEVRCGDKLLLDTGLNGTLAVQVTPCRYEVKVRNPEPYGQRYQLIVQSP